MTMLVMLESKMVDLFLSCFSSYLSLSYFLLFIFLFLDLVKEKQCDVTYECHISVTHVIVTVTTSCDMSER